MDDLIFRQAAIDAADRADYTGLAIDDVKKVTDEVVKELKQLPSAQPESRREWYMKGYREAQDAALHESCTDCPLYDHDGHMCPRFNKVIPTTIQEIRDTWTQRWIPVTERLPKESGQYLITVKYKHVNGYEDIYTEHGEWSDYGWDMFCLGHCGEVEDIIAWMPLPMPYREERQDDA